MNLTTLCKSPRTKIATCVVVYLQNMHCLRLYMINQSLNLKHRTIGTNFPISCSLNSNATQFGHSSHKVGVENVGTGSKGINGVPRPWVREEDLVRGEEALSLLKVLVINIVEFTRSCWVHVDGNPRIHVSWAHLLQLGYVLLVQCWVHWGAVYSTGELAAVGESKGVCTCQKKSDN